jgi:hypothetical protein
MNVTGTTICRFVASDGLTRYSVRERPDGLFLIVHDGATLEDGSHPYWMEDRILSGLFGSASLAESELERMIGDEWTREI